MEEEKPQPKPSRKQLEAEIKRGRAQIIYMGEHDLLTGIANLTLMRDKIRELIQLHPQGAMAILLLGMDNFRLINDTMGSLMGDLLLSKISKRMTQVFCSIDLFARKGGDEFVLVIFNDDIHEVVKQAKIILHALSLPFILGEQTVYMTACMGISRAPQDADNVEDLLTFADIAMNDAKDAGKNSVRLYTKKLGEKASYLQQLEKNLYQAIDKDEFYIQYQPLVATSNQQMIGMEALLRWKNPQLGLIPPAVFIPLAEKTRQINAIGDWVLHKVCVQAKQWQLAGKAFTVSVNVSGLQFQTLQGFQGYTLLKSVRHALRNAALPAEFLVLEMTESTLMKDDFLVRNTLKKLKDMGICIACDDFGVGYSSFSRLKKLPIDVLKIDKSLIDDVPDNPVDLAIVRAILTISGQLKIKVVAEGVERKAQFDALLQMGCDIVQGNYFGKPVLPGKLKW